MDHIDRSILDLLQMRGRITNAQLAEDIGLSPASTLERVRKMEGQGVIKSYHARLDPNKLSFSMSLWLPIELHSLQPDHVSRFQAAVLSLPEVVTCYRVLGEAHFLLNAVTTDIKTYQEVLLAKLSAIDSVKTIHSWLITDTLKETGLPVKSLALR